MDKIAQAQSYFPRGLYQPPGSFRFSSDALLLASFSGQMYFPAKERDPLHLLDLGCGCGVAAFALLLHNPRLSAIGLDIQEKLVQASLNNADRLGLSKKYQAVTVNLEEVRTKEDYLQICPSRKQDLVTANPPYRLEGSGRLPKNFSRRQALFGTKHSLSAFVHVASLALSATGFFCLIFPFARREELFLCLEAHGLCPVKELRIYSKPDAKAPAFVLTASQKTPRVRLNVETLTLYQGRGTDTVLTNQALDFCPFLACKI
ncbi:MAG: methyltransferase domain-containing protein [Deltaproteobacteria bacterium]|nr:methyltransferase domain-containing protein [Deltaproteobacteria bacterium]